MALAFLNKKAWHPEKFSNIEKVWAAEQKEDDDNKSVKSSHSKKEV